MSDPIFTDVLKREIYPGNITEFKKEAKFSNDRVKDQFMIKRGILASSKPVLGYWWIRGIASNIRYQLAYCNVDYDLKEYFATNYQEWFAKDKKNLGLSFANIPYLIHGDAKITESMAIHHYIAEVWDQTLLGKNVKDRAMVSMLHSILHEFRWKLVRLCYDQDDKQKVIEEYKNSLPPIVKYLGDNDFLIGDYPTYIDFHFFETIQLMVMVSEGQVLKDFIHLDLYNKRFKELKGVKEYVSDPFCYESDRPLNAPRVSKINGKVPLNGTEVKKID